MDIRGRGTTMAKQFQFQFQDFTVCLSKFCPFFLSPHSLLHMMSLSLIRSNSSSPFASVSFHSLSLCLCAISFSVLSPIILAACSSKSDFYTTNWFPISIAVSCKEIPSQSPVFHPFLGRRNFIARDWYILHLKDLLCI